jgi:translation elongation factor EF-Tu-like GTPase
MGRPPKPPDAEVLFELTSRAYDGEVKRVLSGYRPLYEIRTDYWTSVHHEFKEQHGVATGEQVEAEVWFISPEAYPHSLWVGRILVVAEGPRVVGRATVSKVLNSALFHSGA